MQDIWRHIHSLLPMRDVARAACVSSAFLRSWRCHPNLTFSRTTLGVKKAYKNGAIARDFPNKVDHILRNHSGIGIEELAVTLPMKTSYNFPCSLLSNGSGHSIQSLHLVGCALRPTTELAWLKSLTKVRLQSVYFTGDGLGCLLCNSLALEWLEIRCCDGIVRLKVPCVLQRLRYLEVIGCDKLEVIDSKAPNISSFFYEGDRVQLSLGEALLMEKIHIIFSGAVHYARAELPSSVPNLKIATIRSSREITTTPMLHSKFLHLKKLSIALSTGTFSPGYDYFSLVSFLDACPSLETLILDVSFYSYFYPSNLRKMQGQQHHKMKSVMILGFTSARSLIELTCHSLLRCYVPIHKTRKCSPLPIDVLMEAQRAVLAIKTYIEPKVPSMVKLCVVEPCRPCHAVEL
ncbi:hypothetical protein HU200_035556 [Digitaria exilis]|uniref:At1g61320/AtMIF1 LRR domain-containing protein n=1 Tax=Digitaria exilis TaxID=1010633 RepID=A0A835BTR1_9POAL|nr:hypothetical protein HU200_035556 [Digitaria exilis]